MKWFVILCVLILVGGIFLSLGAVSSGHELDMLEVNRIIRSVEDNWPAALSNELTSSDLRTTFIEPGESLHAYIQNRDTLIPIVIDEYTVGTLVVYNETSADIETLQTRLLIIFYSQLVLLAIAAGIFALYQYKTILRPFRKLEHFAGRVASGDLDSPLEMDRQNRFGAFSESFDLMREQLALARENERLANIRKKELVASLSHDIKTPASSIKIIAELHGAKHGETDEMKAIIGKIDQIDLLISNMFSATLEELEQLKVSVKEVPTTELEDDIRAADFEHKIKPFHLPECVLTVDRLRFRQVIDNIIGNSYKYADTEIEVTGEFDGAFFVLSIRDFGPGVSNDELGLLCEKFYRAENAKDKSGSGLGLYLSTYFLTEMDGTLTIENQNGLCVSLRFPI
ncbi:MAG: HAMP domain-containing histidine kinase [Oscillospiraceae bacterium]|nr:HAMP domain-containing histidine kinase [Oscillospiraceae bacterium]